MARKYQYIRWADELRRVCGEDYHEEPDDEIEPADDHEERRRLELIKHPPERVRRLRWRD